MQGCGVKPRKTGRQTCLREDEPDPPLRKLQSLMHLFRHGRRADCAGHADHQPGHCQPRNHDKDDHLEQGDSTTSDDGYAAISQCAHLRIHWTVAFPVTGLMTTTRGPPVAFKVTVA